MTPRRQRRMIGAIVAFALSILIGIGRAFWDYDARWMLVPIGIYLPVWWVQMQRDKG